MSDIQGEQWIKLAATSAIPKGKVMAVQYGDRALAVYHLDDGTFCVTDNICTHQHAELSEGFLDGDLIECPLHAGCFNVRTGKGQGAPIEQDLKTYTVRIDGTDILFRL